VGGKSLAVTGKLLRVNGRSACIAARPPPTSSRFPICAYRPCQVICLRCREVIPTDRISSTWALLAVSKSGSTCWM
jgi:hypothetical protein